VGVPFITDPYFGIPDPYFCNPDANPKNIRGNVNYWFTFLKITKKHSITVTKLKIILVFRTGRGSRSTNKNLNPLNKNIGHNDPGEYKTWYPIPRYTYMITNPDIRGKKSGILVPAHGVTKTLHHSADGLLEGPIVTKL
jgi:hypothetical protein